MRLLLGIGNGLDLPSSLYFFHSVLLLAYFVGLSYPVCAKVRYIEK